MLNNEENIISSSDRYVVKETSVHLSDEKLRTALSRAYEKAQKDMNEFKLRKYYSIFLSVASTLFLSLMTSEFKSIGQISAQTVTFGAWVLCIVCAVEGFILLAMHVSEKTQNNTSNRDKAVDEIVKQYIRLDNLGSSSAGSFPEWYVKSSK